MIPRDANHPNKSSRLKLKTIWDGLDSHEQDKLRAIRAQRGMVCDYCEAVGVFREVGIYIDKVEIFEGNIINVYMCAHFLMQATTVTTAVNDYFGISIIDLCIVRVSFFILLISIYT